MPQPVAATRQVAANHPTGVSTVLAGALVVIASKAFGVDLSAEDAAIIVAAVGAVVSWLSPRFPTVIAADLEDDSTGPDPA